VGLGSGLGVVALGLSSFMSTTRHVLDISDESPALRCTECLFLSIKVASPLLNQKQNSSHHPPPHPSPRPHPQQFVRRCGTPLYMAPEIFKKDYHVQADM